MMRWTRWLTSSTRLPGSRQEAETERRQQTKRKRLANDVGNLGCFVDLAPDHQNVAILHASRDRARLLLPTIGMVQPNDLRALRRHIDFETARQLCHIPRNPVPADTKQAGKLNAAGILP